MAQQPTYDGENLHIYPRTMFGTAFVYDVETEEGDVVRLLEVGGAFESATYVDARRFEPTFAYYKSFDALFEAFPEPERVLMLGGGGCAYPKHFVTSQPHGAIDVVEIDPAVIRIARKHFFVDELIEMCGTGPHARVNLICADAREFLQSGGEAHNAGGEEIDERASKVEGENAGAIAAVPSGASAGGRVLYEAIINDSFAGAQASSSLVDEAGLTAVRSRLVPDGLYLINFICSLEEDAAPLLELIGALRAAFKHVHVVPCADDVFGDEDNNLVIATDGTYSFEGELPLPPDELLR